MTKDINRANQKHDDIRKKLLSLPAFNQGVRITQKDVIKYKLWEELADNGHKTIYTNTTVPLEQLFSKNFDVEHIIPKARLFDDEPIKPFPHVILMPKKEIKQGSML